MFTEVVLKHLRVLGLALVTGLGIAGILAIVPMGTALFWILAWLIVFGVFVRYISEPPLLWLEVGLYTLLAAAASYLLQTIVMHWIVRGLLS